MPHAPFAFQALCRVRRPSGAPARCYASRSSTGTRGAPFRPVLAHRPCRTPAAIRAVRRRLKPPASFGPMPTSAVTCVSAGSAFLSTGDEFHRAQETGRVTCGKQLLRICAFRARAAEFARRGQLHFQLVVSGYRAAVAATRARGAGLVQNVHRAAPVWKREEKRPGRTGCRRPPTNNRTQIICVQMNFEEKARQCRAGSSRLGRQRSLAADSASRNC